jgi:hypothetical protein
MSTIKVIDDKFGSLVYHSDKKIVHHCFHHELDSVHFRNILNTGIELLKQHKAVKWLSDNREIGPHSEEDGTWTNNDWLPRVIAAGWKYWALVVPNDVKARMNMSEFVNSFYEMGVRIMVFTDVEQAMEWLERVDQKQPA